MNSKKIFTELNVEGLLALLATAAMVSIKQPKWLLEEVEKRRLQLAMNLQSPSKDALVEGEDEMQELNAKQLYAINQQLMEYHKMLDTNIKTQLEAAKVYAKALKDMTAPVSKGKEEDDDDDDEAPFDLDALKRQAQSLKSDIQTTVKPKVYR